MLMPKRVKRRRVHRGRMKGEAQKGNKVAYGEYGLAAVECGWITSRQIEAARIAMTRYIKRGGQVWIDIFPHKLVELKTELFNLRFSHATHQLTNPMQLKSTKRDIARIKTVLSERSKRA